jgi:type IV secretion system protein TrbC
MNNTFLSRSRKRSTFHLGRVLKFMLFVALLSMPVMAQGPWGQAAEKLSIEFTGPIARGLSLVAIVIGGLTLAFSDGGGKRTIGGLVFGLGLALGATQFLTWLF